MKNAMLIKIVVVTIVVLLIMAVIGQCAKTDTTKSQKEPSTNIELETLSSIEKLEVAEEIEKTVIPETNMMETETTMTAYEETTIEKYFHPEDFPEEEPEAETFGLDIDVQVYYTNTKSLDESDKIPLTAWEKLTVSTQKYFNQHKIQYTEIQVIEGSLIEEEGKITFQGIFPEELSAKHTTLTVIYDLELQEFSYTCDIQNQ